MKESGEHTCLNHSLTMSSNALSIKIRADGASLTLRIIGDGNDGSGNNLALESLKLRHSVESRLGRKRRGEHREERAHLIAVKDDIILTRGHEVCADLAKRLAYCLARHLIDGIIYFICFNILGDKLRDILDPSLKD